jgi:hypothetical protein
MKKPQGDAFGVWLLSMGLAMVAVYVILVAVGAAVTP